MSTWYCLIYHLILNLIFFFKLYRKYGRVKARLLLLTTNQKNIIVKDSLDCKNCLENTVEIIKNEKEYNDTNLFFYCKYFDAKTKSIKKLPPNHTDLFSKHISCIKKL